MLRNLLHFSEHDADDVAIPRGETRTYAEVARAINRPTAARAVARACATNPVAVAVPCHRVVPAAGGVGGYRWGSGRKEKLLAALRRVFCKQDPAPPDGRIGGDRQHTAGRRVAGLVPTRAEVQADAGVTEGP